MTDPLELRPELERTLTLAAQEAQAYVAGLGDEPVRPAGVDERLDGFDPALPENGAGAPEAIAELAELGRANATRSSGPRFFHFVMGGTTPAALGADWLTSAFDQSAFAWASSAFGSRLEAVAVGWLRALFELPPEFGGVLVTGTTMANFTGLIAARSWWAERCGFDADEAGLAGAPAPVILSSGYVHPSAMQAIGMAGLGRAQRPPARPRRRRPAGPRGAGRRARLQRAGDRDRQRRRGERRRLRPAGRDRRAHVGQRRRLAARRRGVRALRAPGAGVARPDRGDRACRLDHGRLPQVAQRALRLRGRVRARAGPAGAGAQLRRSVPAAPRRPPPQLRLPRAGELAALARPDRLGDAARVRTLRSPRDGRTPPRARSRARRAGRPRARARAARRREAEHRLLPCPPRGGRRGRARRAERPPRGAATGGRPGLLRHDGLRREGRLPTGDRQLADDGARRAAADRRAAGTARGGQTK